MAFGGRQWPPYSHSSSSSTLSPLAPPFTVDRKPYDHASGRDWRPLRTDLVQAEPFYPHYGPAGRGSPPWNGPFDEGSGGGAKPSSSSLSPWMGRTETGDSLWIGPAASAAPNQGLFADGSPVENTWCSNLVDPYVRNHFESDCQGWLKDKTYVQTKDSIINSENSSGSGFSITELTRDAFPYSSSQAASRVAHDTINSTSVGYFGPTMQNGPWRDGGVPGPATVYCPPANISKTFHKSNYFLEKDPKAEKSPIGTVDKYALGKRHISVNIRVPSRNPSSEVDTGAKSNNKGENNAEVGAIFLNLNKEHASLGQGISSEESQEKVHAKSGLTNICLGASSSSESGYVNKNSETIDQHILAEDSPCWKGALASRQSPFHSVGTFVAKSLAMDKNIEDAVVEVLEGSDVIDLKLDSLSCPSEKKREVSYLDNVRSGSKPEGSVDAFLTKSDISSSAHCLSENEFASFKEVSQPATSHVCSLSWDSFLKGVSHIVNPVGPPKSSHLNSSTKPLTGNYLFRTLYDLSAFCFSYSGSDIMLNESDYELLLMSMYNIEACLLKRNQCGDKKECQHDPTQVEYLGKEGNNSMCEVINVEKPEMPNKMQPLLVGACDESVGLPLPISGSNFTENDVMKDFQTSLSAKFNGEVDGSEASLYKKLWIEAEAALCKMKFELHLARAKVEPQNIQDKNAQGVNMQNNSGSEVNSDNKRSLPSITHELASDKENCLKSVRMEKSHNELNIIAAASSPELDEVVASGVINTKEVDPAVMARARVLLARGVGSLKVDVQDQFPPAVSSDICIGPRQNSSRTSCSDDEFDVGACFQASPARSAIGVTPWVSNIGVAGARNGESVIRSANSSLITSRDVPASMYKVDGRGNAVRLHAGVGNRTVIDSYIPNTMWQGNTFQDGKQGSSSSEWEHVLQEDFAL